MKFEYQPVQLRAWLRKHTAIGEPKELFSREGLERLEETFRSVQGSGIPALQRWVRGLSRREKRLIPYLLRDEEDKERSRVLRPVVSRGVTRDWRIFYVLRDVLFHTGKAGNIHLWWMWLRRAYQSHRERIERGMEPRQIGKWRKWTAANARPAYHLAELVRESEKGFLEELRDLGLTEHHPFFWAVWMETLRAAPAEFFLREEPLCRRLFLRAASRERQNMAQTVIGRGMVERVPSLGRLIYQKMGTYRMQPAQWQQVDDREKHGFHQWVVQWKTREFHEMVTLHHRRVRYWEKFIHRLEHVVVTDEKKTLILYFADVVIMEVLGVGAAYVYDISTFRLYFQPILDSSMSQEEPNGQGDAGQELIRSRIRDVKRVLEGGRLVHRHNWQEQFDQWLSSRLGWDVE